MNSATAQIPSASPFNALAQALRDYVIVCEELLGFMTAESAELRQTGEHQPFNFHQSRKGLLARLERPMNAFRQCGLAWRKASHDERANHPEVKSLLARAQDIVVKLLVLDRENQQALLRRGLLPANALSSATNARPHYVAQLYQRHASAPTAADSAR